MNAVCPGLTKILELEPLLARLGPLRQGQKIVFTNGCFDILHPGHTDLLYRAKALGDVLVIGLNTDASVSGLKGPSRPINPFLDRALVLSALGCVDFVTGFAEATPARLIAAICPDVLVKGGDWPVESIAGRGTVQAHGGLVISLPLLAGHSTTAILARVAAMNQMAGKPGQP